MTGNKVASPCNGSSLESSHYLSVFSFSNCVLTHEDRPSITDVTHGDFGLRFESLQLILLATYIDCLYYPI